MGAHRTFVFNFDAILVINNKSHVSCEYYIQTNYTVFRIFANVMRACTLRHCVCALLLSVKVAVQSPYQAINIFFLFRNHPVLPLPGEEYAQILCAINCTSHVQQAKKSWYFSLYTYCTSYM